ncbi:hypothetical protein [Variovorax sp. dw_308]|uniref:hypothetical protein n=1 Tax=Variovorax sp. dw_308 TaxID=2721546 RepID=UPI001C44472B|nr:hypothetical protein [Variovorax sp. dw_308]
MKSIAKTHWVKLFACAVALVSVAACGGGGGGGGGNLFLPVTGGGSGTGTGTEVSGTVARGVLLAGATVNMTCANGATLAGTANALGFYTTGKAAITYPCIGSAKLGNLTYRGILFSGTVANFTPLTDLLVEVTEAAAGVGPTSLSMAELINKVTKDGTFADSLVAAASSYRATVLDVVKALLIADGHTEAESNLFLQAARTLGFDVVSFVLGSDLDKCLENIASVTQNADGSVKASALAAAKAAGDKLPLPVSGPTGATAGTGASGN